MFSGVLGWPGQEVTKPKRKTVSHCGNNDFLLLRRPNKNSQMWVSDCSPPNTFIPRVSRFFFQNLHPTASRFLSMYIHIYIYIYLYIYIFLFIYLFIYFSFFFGGGGGGGRRPLRHEANWGTSDHVSFCFACCVFASKHSRERTQT